MSDEYIKKEDTLKAMGTWDKFGCDAHGRLAPYTEDYAPYVKYDDMLKAVEGLPTADVVPVVRCKDCRWQEECVITKLLGGGNGYCRSGEWEDDE